MNLGEMTLLFLGSAFLHNSGEPEASLDPPEAWVPPGLHPRQAKSAPGEVPATGAGGGPGSGSGRKATGISRPQHIPVAQWAEGEGPCLARRLGHVSPGWWHLSRPPDCAVSSAALGAPRTAYLQGEHMATKKSAWWLGGSLLWTGSWPSRPSVGGWPFVPSLLLGPFWGRASCPAHSSSWS